MTHSHVRHDSSICAAWLIHVCNMTHSYVWHDSFRCAAWLIYTCDKTHSYVWHDSFICVTWLIHTYEERHESSIGVQRDMTHPHVWHDSSTCVTYSFIRATWLIYMCDMIHSYVRRDSSICAACLIHVCDMTHSYVWHDSFIRMSWFIHMIGVTHSYVWRETWPIHKCKKRHDSSTCVTGLIHMCAKTHSYVRHDSCICSIWLTVWLTVISMTHAIEWVMLMIHVYVRYDSQSQSYRARGRIHRRDMSYSYVWRETWLIRMCDMTHPHVWHDSFVCAKLPREALICMCECLICMCECLIPRHGKRSNDTWYDAFICMNHVGDTSHPYARHDASIFKNHVCDTSHPQWIICVRVDTSHPYVIKWVMCVRHSHQWIMCATRLSPMCATRRINMYESCLRHVPSMCHLLQHACATRLIQWIMFTTRRIHVAHMNEPCLIHVILNHACDTFHPCVRHVSSNESCVCDASHPCVRYDTLICATGLIHTCAMTLSHSG